MGRKPAKAKSRAKRPAVSTPRTAEASVVRNLEKRLAEALKGEAEAREHQAATSEILRVVRSSPTDMEPVFDTLARSAMRLCAAYDVIILQMEGDALHRVAHHGPVQTPSEPFFAPTRDTVGGRTVLERRAIHVADLQIETEEFPVGSRVAQQLGSRTVLGVPLLRDGAAIGVIYLRRTEVQPFTDSQIALLQTFADQAVIAIENVRLFTELQQKNEALMQAHAQTTEALEQQTATSEILSVISQSPTDLQPVLDAMAESAARLCTAYDASIFRLDADGLRLVAHHGPIPNPIGLVVPAIRGTVTGRTVRDREIVQVVDVQAETEQFPEGSTLARELGHRTVLAVPLLREGAAIGVIGLRRTEVLPFTDNQIDLLKTFANQAVIAIENVRLFAELQASNRGLTEALEQQTATAEILKVPTTKARVLRMARVCRDRRSHVVRTQSRRSRRTGCRLRGQDPQGGEARRSPGRAAHEV